MRFAREINLIFFFRESNKNKSYQYSIVNFFGLIERIGKLDLIMQNRVRRIQDHETGCEMHSGSCIPPNIFYFVMFFLSSISSWFLSKVTIYDVVHLTHDILECCHSWDVNRHN